VFPSSPVALWVQAHPSHAASLLLCVRILHTDAGPSWGGKRATLLAAAITLSLAAPSQAQCRNSCGSLQSCDSNDECSLVRTCSGCQEDRVWQSLLSNHDHASRLLTLPRHPPPLPRFSVPCSWLHCGHCHWCHHCVLLLPLLHHPSPHTHLHVRTVG
jgi:hypothetical protein